MEQFLIITSVLVVVLLMASAIWSWRRAAYFSEKYPPVGEVHDVDGVQLHYLHMPPSDRGGQTIVLLHGASANLNDARHALAADLAGRHGLLFLDRPGHGWSGRGGRHVASPTQQAHLIIDLMDRLGIERAVMVGHSWGASLAATLAVDYADRVSGLVFLAPATHPWPGGVLWYYRFASWPVIGWLFTRTIVTPIAEIAMASALRGVFVPDRPPADYIEATRAWLVLRPDEFRNNAEDIADLNNHLAIYAPRYGEISVPTTIVTGDADTIVSPQIHSDALHQEIAGAQLMILPNAGHMPHYTHKADVIAAIDDVVARSRESRAAAE